MFKRSVYIFKLFVSLNIYEGALFTLYTHYMNIQIANIMSQTIHSESNMGILVESSSTVSNCAMLVGGGHLIIQETALLQ